MTVQLAGDMVLLGGRDVGRIEGDVFVSSRRSALHFFRRFQGYGVSEEVLDFLFENGVRRVVLVVDRMKLLEASVMDFARFGKPWTDFPAFRKPDEQRVLPISFFKTLSENQQQPMKRAEAVVVL